MKVTHPWMSLRAWWSNTWLPWHPSPFSLRCTRRLYLCLWALSHSWLVEFQMCTDSVFKQQHQRFYSLNMPLLKFCVSFSLVLFCRISLFFHLFVFVCYQVLWPLIQCHNCVRNMNCKYCCLDSCLMSSKCCIVATCIKLIMHNMLYSLCGLISVEGK